VPAATCGELRRRATAAFGPESRRWSTGGSATGASAPTWTRAAFAAGFVAQLRGLGLELLIDDGAFKVDRVRKEIVRSISASLAANRLGASAPSEATPSKDLSGQPLTC